MKRYNISIIIILTLITGCSNVGSTPYSSTALSPNIDFQMAKTLTKPQSRSYQVKAITEQLNNQQTTAARRSLQSLKTQNSTPEQTVEYLFLQAQLNSELLKYQASQQDLNAIVRLDTPLSTDQSILWYNLAATNSRGVGDLVTTLNNYKSLSSLIAHDDIRFTQLLHQCWHALEESPPAELKQLYNQSSDSFIKGWIALANITHSNSLNDTPLNQAIVIWKRTYPHHIANALLPKAINSSTLPMLHIGLLLPSSGAYAESARAIKYGLISSYYEYLRQHSSQNMRINFYDTSSETVVQAYQHALNDGANLIIGPLSQSAVTSLNHSQTLSIPVIALNRLPQNTPAQTNLYQFSLSPDHEISELIAKARQDQHKNILLITPNTSRGQRVAHSISSQWIKTGGNVIQQMNYSNTHSLSYDIRHLLNLGQSYLRERKLSILLQKKLRMTPRRRQDFDAFFLVADTAYAKQIRPLLKFYYAGAVPIYALSSVYEGNLDRQRDRDLDGIIFYDQPWVVTSKLHPHSLNVIRNNLKTLWPQLYFKYPRLFALGVDSLTIATHFNRLTLLPKLSFTGATGSLQVNEQRQIIALGQYSQFINGRVTA